MSKSITEKELAEKLESISASMPGLDKKEAWTRVAREAAELLGVELADDKTEPGATGWHEDTRRPAFVDERGSWRVIMPNGEIAYVDDGHDFPVPARVVPAAPVELSEEEVMARWNEAGSNYYWGILDTHHDSPGRKGEWLREDIVATVNDALAKHGRGRVFHQSTIEDALHAGLKGTGEDLSPKAGQRAADAVYSALLEASK